MRDGIFLVLAILAFVGALIFPFLGPSGMFAIFKPAVGIGVGVKERLGAWASEEGYDLPPPVIIAAPEDGLGWPEWLVAPDGARLIVIEAAEKTIVSPERGRANIEFEGPTRQFLNALMEKLASGPWSVYRARVDLRLSGYSLTDPKLCAIVAESSDRRRMVIYTFELRRNRAIGRVDWADRRVFDTKGLEKAQPC